MVLPPSSRRQGTVHRTVPLKWVLALEPKGDVTLIKFFTPRITKSIRENSSIQIRNCEYQSSNMVVFSPQINRTATLNARVKLYIPFCRCIFWFYLPCL